MPYRSYQMLLHFVMIAWPFLLATPLVLLIRDVRKRTALRVAALTVVGGSYLVLLISVPAVIGAWIMVAADNPANNFVTHAIDRAQVLAGIRFPKGSTVTRYRSDDKISDVVLSEDLVINGIPAGKGTKVSFHSDGTVGYLTTGRVWVYRGIPVPAGSTVFMITRGCTPAIPSPATTRATKGWTCGIYAIDLSQPSDATLNVEGMLVHGPAVLDFNGDTLRSLSGDYVWRGERYKSYRVDVDGQIKRQPE